MLPPFKAEIYEQQIIFCWLQSGARDTLHMPIDFPRLSMYMIIPLHIIRQLASGWLPEVLTPLKGPLISHFPWRRAVSAKSLHMGASAIPMKRKGVQSLQLCRKGYILYVRVYTCVFLCMCVYVCVCVCVGQCRAQLFSLMSWMKSKDQHSNFNPKFPITNCYLYFSRLLSLPVIIVWYVHDVSCLYVCATVIIHVKEY